MCLIVDACVASKVFGSRPSEDFAAIVEWLGNKDGCLTTGGHLETELLHMESGRRMLRQLKQAGRLRQEAPSDVEAEEGCVRKENKAKSNDPHVLALARVSGARVLCTDDSDLMDDFRNRDVLSPPGRILTKKDHLDMLREKKCKAARKVYVLARQKLRKSR